MPDEILLNDDEEQALKRAWLKIEKNRAAKKPTAKQVPELTKPKEPKKDAD